MDDDYGGADRSAAAAADPDALLRMRLAIPDAAFVADGLTLGLLLKWAERAPPFDGLPPSLRTRRAPVGKGLVPTGRRGLGA